MQGRTYRYFDGEPLYPFGFGLSYTQFNYSNLEIKRENNKVIINVSVKNNGSMDGDEVVQVYVSDQKASAPAAIKSLKAFKRISLKRNESRDITFELGMNDFAVYKNEKWEIEPGDFKILVGENSVAGLSQLIKL